MKYAKTAVCISGEVRTAIEAYPSFKEFFSGKDIDVFIHTWDTTVMKSKNGETPIVIDERKESLDKIIELYKPKKILMESNIKLPVYASFGKMFYSIMMANQLRLDYEIENDMLYEWVVKYRFDILFPVGTKFPDYPLEKRTMYYLLGNQGIAKEECGAHGISDIIFWGDSQIMTVLSDSYRHYKYHLMKTLNDSQNGIYFNTDVNKTMYSPGQIIYKRAIEHNIRPVEIRPFVRHTLWRTDIRDIGYQNYDLINERYCKDA